MKIKFQNVKIENFLSIGNAEVDLEDRGYCLITGVNNNPSDMAKSNGSGKSSIIEAICWALTGETIRGVKDVVNMFTTGGTSVELNFKVDSTQYKIIRYKEHKTYKTDLKIHINGEDKSGKGIRDSQKLLESYLPDLTASLIGSVILLGQGLPQRFTNNTPSGRKEVLEKLSKSDFMIEDLKKRIGDRKIFLNSELRKVEDTILSNETLIKSLNQQIKQCEERLSQLEDPSIYEDLIQRAKEKIAFIDGKIEELRDQLKQHRLKLDSTQKEKAQSLTSILEEEKSYNDEYIRSKYLLESKLNSIKGDIYRLNSDIQKAKNVKDVCPTCNQKLPGVFKPDLTPLTSSLVEKTKSEYELKNQLLELQEKNSPIVEKFSKQKEEATRELDKIILESQAHIQSLERSLAQIQNERNAESSNLSRYESLKASYQATVTTINQTIAGNSIQIKELQEKTVYYHDEKSNLTLRLDAINKFTTIANRDFRGYLLKNVIDFINKKAKEYCKDVFDTTLIDFTLEGNNIDIRYSGKQYEVLSGGEKHKIDIIILLSIRDMLCQFLDFRCNILAVDEIFDNLDSTSCDKVLDLLSKKLIDLESIFIISHHTDLAIPQDCTITVVKNSDGVSLIQ